jgi:hypothetical protein
MKRGGRAMERRRRVMEPRASAMEHSRGTSQRRGCAMERRREAMERRREAMERRLRAGSGGLKSRGAPGASGQPVRPVNSTPSGPDRSRGPAMMVNAIRRLSAEREDHIRQCSGGRSLRNRSGRPGSRARSRGRLRLDHRSSPPCHLFETGSPSNGTGTPAVSSQQPVESRENERERLHHRSDIGTLATACRRAPGAAEFPGGVEVGGAG